jgi:hypothetical protein
LRFRVEFPQIREEPTTVKRNIVAPQASSETAYYILHPARAAAGLVHHGGTGRQRLVAIAQLHLIAVMLNGNIHYNRGRLAGASPPLPATELAPAPPKC